MVDNCLGSLSFSLLYTGIILACFNLSVHSPNWTDKLNISEGGSLSISLHDFNTFVGQEYKPYYLIGRCQDYLAFYLLKSDWLKEKPFHVQDH